MAWVLRMRELEIRYAAANSGTMRDGWHFGNINDDDVFGEYPGHLVGPEMASKIFEYDVNGVWDKQTT